MAIIVQKYGGSSVADVGRLQAVARKVVATKEAGHQLVVVVSAMGNTTDELLTLARQLNAQPDRRELDMLLSVGERISMTLLSMAIHALGHEAISFTGSQVGIITNDAHSNARIIDVRPFRIQDELARGRIVIVAGFQGTSYKREVTTLGRGGSDMTAVALAGALSAEACEIYSDVDGVYTSDPREVLDARRLDAVTADEMLELARHGARVLHAEAVAWAKRHGIALYARATHVEESKGTVIRPDGWPADALASTRIAPKGVAAIESVLVASGRSCDVERLLDETAPGATLLSSSETRAGDTGRIELVVDPTNCTVGLEAAHDAMAARLDDGDVTTDLSSVTAVGEDIGRSGRWLGRVEAALAEAGIRPRRIDSGPHVITTLVANADRVEAMRALHRLVTHGADE